jgi:hypothetical protein
MVCRFTIPTLLVASALLVPVHGFGQIGYPGQYPGQYPPGQGPYPGAGGGIRLPGQRRGSTTTTTKEEQARTSSITGILRRISSSELIVQSDDKRIVTLSLARATNYLKASGGAAKSSDFGPGDHITVDATQDDNGYYHAKNVTLVKQGNAEEQIAASAPVDSSPVADGQKNSSSGDDDGPPRLRRSDSTSDSSQSDRSETPRPVARANTPDKPVPPDPDDAGPPKLRRGTPQQHSSGDTTQIASTETPAARPSLHADEVNGVATVPPPPKPGPAAPADSGERPSAAGARSTGDTVVDKAREAAFEFSETLPNYVVKQFTTRYQTDTAHGSQTSWQAIDTVSADVVSEGGKETYKNLLVNGKPPKEAIEKTGTWSTGEFSSVLLDVFSPATDADFHNKRSSTIASRAAFRYDFSVNQENSHWHVYSAADSYSPEYAGAIWIDKETYRVLRIELSARNMPRAFPLDTVESAVDYDFVLLGENKFLLPVHSEALSCERGTKLCSRNVIDFRNYKKFGADTSITFDPVK